MRSRATPIESSLSEILILQLARPLNGLPRSRTVYKSVPLKHPVRKHKRVTIRYADVVVGVGGARISSY